jgi:hypothetical protein
LLPREKESEKRRGRTKKEEGKNALQRLPSGRGFFYPVKEVQKKAFSRLKIAFFNRDRRDGWKKKKRGRKKAEAHLSSTPFISSRLVAPSCREFSWARPLQGGLKKKGGYTTTRYLFHSPYATCPHGGQPSPPLQKRSLSFEKGRASPSLKGGPLKFLVLRKEHHIQASPSVRAGLAPSAPSRRGRRMRRGLLSNEADLPSFPILSKERGRNIPKKA